MHKLSQRAVSLKEKALNWDKIQEDYIGQRMYYSLEALAAAPEDEPWMKRKSRMLSNVLQRADVILNADELIVGFNYYGDDMGMWSEVNFSRVCGKEKEALVNYLKRGNLDHQQVDFILHMLDNIEQYVPGVPFTRQQSKEFSGAEADGVVWAPGIPENHTVIGYEKVLKKGFTGIRDEIKEELEKVDKTDLKSINKMLLLESMLQIAESACCIGKRYKDKALEMLESSSDAGQKKNLSERINVLDKVPGQPAATFHEAVQSLWFAHIINTWEDGINANSLGRLDQVLYPYYKKDIDEGRLTEERAFEILCCLWIKLYRDYDVQQVVLGGVNANGEDATNELTYLMLDVTEALDFVRCLSVRINRNSPMKLIHRSLEIVAKGKGIPFFFNDEILIPALAGSGISLEDARDYGAIGCIEITIPGKANPHAVSNRVNLLKCLELALNNGVSMTTGKQVGLKTGDPANFQCIQDIIDAYEKQVEFFTKLACFESIRCEMQNSYLKPMPYKSILTEGCLSSGRDFNDGGARYNYHESMAMGIPNVADSLTALHQLVFQEKRYSLQEVIEQLRDNFPDESIRMEFLKGAPKFGNDDELVDSYASRVMEHFCTTVKGIEAINGLGFFAQPFTYLWLVEAGERTAATPDGRRKGENLAYSISPMQGRDYKGLTALLNSISKLPNAMAAGSTSAIIEVDPVLFNESNTDMMAILLKTAMEKGVGQIQFNVVNAETLRKAQAEPDQYRNLAVRVSGFSQRFCLLDRKLQDHIIARTKHKVG